MYYFTKSAILYKSMSFPKASCSTGWNILYKYIIEKNAKFCTIAHPRIDTADVCRHLLQIGGRHAQNMGVSHKMRESWYAWDSERLELFIYLPSYTPSLFTLSFLTLGWQGNIQHKFSCRFLECSLSRHLTPVSGPTRVDYYICLKSLGSKQGTLLLTGI